MGGTTIYKGQSLDKAHENLSIDDFHFDVFCELLENCMKEQGADEEALKEFFIFIEPQRE